MNSDELMRGLARLASDLGPALAPEGHFELLGSIIDAARNIFRAKACSVALLDDDQEHLVFYIASGEGSEEVVGRRVPVGHGIAGWVVSSGQPIAIADVQRDPRFARDVAEATGYVPRSILAMPLETERQMLGVIEVLDQQKDRPGAADDMQLLSLFARQAALAIENSKVFADLGNALFSAAARATDDVTLGRALLQTADEAPPPDPDLAELAAHFQALGNLGPDERRAATALVGRFLEYLRSQGQSW